MTWYTIVNRSIHGLKARQTSKGLTIELRRGGPEGAYPNVAIGRLLHYTESAQTEQKYRTMTFVGLPDHVYFY